MIKYKKTCCKANGNQLSPVDNIEQQIICQKMIAADCRPATLIYIYIYYQTDDITIRFWFLHLHQMSYWSATLQLTLKPWTYSFHQSQNCSELSILNSDKRFLAYETISCKVSWLFWTICQNFCWLCNALLGMNHGAFVALITT